MEIKFIKELMSVMGRTGLQRLSLKVGDSELTLERSEQVDKQQQNPERAQDIAHEQLYSQPRQSQFSHRTSQLPSGPATPEAIVPEVPGVYITSPMVGTFYATPAPEEPSFVKIGDTVDKQTIVGIVEAMKVLNEIKSGVNGTIVEILVDPGQPVEFGTKLFRVTES